MKRVITILFIIAMIFSFKINVLAEGENEGAGGSETTEPTEPSSPSGEEPTGSTEDSKAELSNIKINGTNIVCSNGSNVVCEYIVPKNGDIKSAKVTFDVSEGATTDKESGSSVELNEGTTEFKVVVTSKNGNTKKTYTFKITKQDLSTDSSLKKLSINGTEITLKEGTLKYQTSVSFATKKIEIEAIPNNEKAKVLDFKNNKASFDFFENSKEFRVKVSAEDGQISTYSVTVTKRSAADATLKSLTIKGHQIDFSSDVTDYELKVLKNVSKLEIEAKATDSKATVKITNPKLEIGDNTIKIEVQNDGNTNTYTINVKKLNEDDKTLANLKTLTIEDYEIDFSPSKYEYDLHIDDVNYLVINAEAKLEESEVEITGNLDLENGSIIKIKVSYDDDIYNVYKINIIKDGKVYATKTVSKKAAALVILFDVISMIVLGIVKIKDKINKKEEKKEIEEKKETKKQIKKDNKKNNILENLDDIDVI